MPQGGLKRVHARLQRAMAAVSKDGRCAVESILAGVDRVSPAFFAADWDGADHRPASLTRSKELTSLSATTYDSCSDCRIRSSLRSGRCGTFRLRKIRRDNS